MEYRILDVKDRQEFRRWLIENSATASECWVVVKRGRPSDPGILYYLDAVEEALCFGWIDSTIKVVDGLCLQRFSPRRVSSLWTELNKERVRRLIKLGLMTEQGRRVLPPLGPRSFHMDEEVMEALKKARVWSTFRSFPQLYQRIRVYNVVFFRKRNIATYKQALERLIEETKKGRIYGEWSDYGRLLDY